MRAVYKSDILGMTIKLHIWPRFASKIVYAGKMTDWCQCQTLNSLLVTYLWKAFIIYIQLSFYQLK